MNLWILLAVIVFVVNAILAFVAPWHTLALTNVGLALFALGHIDAGTFTR